MFLLHENEREWGVSFPFILQCKYIKCIMHGFMLLSSSSSFLAFRVSVFFLFCYAVVHWITSPSNSFKKNSSNVDLFFFLFLLAKSYKCLKLRQWSLNVSCFTEWILANKKTNTFHRLLPIPRHRLTRARSLLLTPGNKTLLNVPPRLQIYIV